MSIYKRFLFISGKWPKYPVLSNYCSDLGSTISQQIESTFHYGDNTQIADVGECKKKYKSLARLHSGYHRAAYPRRKNCGFMDCDENNIYELVGEAVAMLTKK